MIVYGYPPALPEGAPTPTPPGLSGREVVLLCFLAAIALVLVTSLVNR